MAQNLIPVTKFIENRYQALSKTGDDFSSILTAAYMESFRQDEIYLTSEQKRMIAFHSERTESLAVIAPTSYGKSQMLISRLSEPDYDNACIIVPTKALLSQTLKRLITANVHELGYRLLSHPDMYTDRINKMICVFTQERLLRLLKKDDDIQFDIVMVDEAHNLFESTDRAMLLAYVLLILKKRNPDVILNFYSPFVANSENLRLKYTEYDLESIMVKENIKSEKFFIIENKTHTGTLLYYDQFLDKPLELSSSPGLDDAELIFLHQGRKNIVYLNKPKDIEDIALKMSEARPNQQEVSSELQDIVTAVSDLFHEDYNLLGCISKGIVYHHGAMPDLIRLYVEYIFSTFDEFQYIIATSTLLEGVNLPADKMFILSTMKGPKNLSPAQFRNLVGRVCRFNEIFSEQYGNLNLLEPEIYLLNGDYTRSGANLKTFLHNTARINKEIKDDVENTLIKPDNELSDDEKVVLQEKVECLENIEPNTIAAEDVRYAATPIGKSCYQNCITEFNIFDNEDALTMALSLYEDPIDNAEGLLDAINDIFLKYVTFTDGQQRSHRAFLRLREEAARRFYAMFLAWRQRGSSYKFMIRSFLKYWDKIEDPIIYVGSSWGERKRTEEDLLPAYLDISKKTTRERVNIAIRKIKEEQDFVDNTLLKYVEVLNDLTLLDHDFYERIKYGTNNPTLICLLKNGFSIDLARVITSIDYAKYVQINTTSDEVFVSSKIEEAMVENGVNRVLIFEIRFHINA
ncbi:MAG: DEAD/DEAH box helicase [Dehalococcoidia bacterium]